MATGETKVVTVKRVLEVESQQLGEILALFGRSDREVIAAVQEAGGFENFLKGVRPLLVPSFAVILGNDEKSFVMYIGMLEGATLMRILDGEETPRPMTNDLCLSFAEALRGTITRAVIAKIEDNTFFGELTLLDHEGKEHAVDCRPSDLLALALATKVPIEVTDAVLQQVPDASRFLNPEGADIDIPVTFHAAGKAVTVPVPGRLVDLDEEEEAEAMRKAGEAPKGEDIKRE